MSLNWDLTKIENNDDLCWYETGEKGEDGKPLVRLNSITEALIWATIAVKLGDITDKNWREFWTRLHMSERVYGPSLRRDGEEYYLSPDDVRAHIGLSCNVCDESKQKFHHAMARGLRDNAERRLRNWKPDDAARRLKEVVDDENAQADGGAENESRQADGGV